MGDERGSFYRLLRSWEKRVEAASKHEFLFRLFLREICLFML